MGLQGRSEDTGRGAVLGLVGAGNQCQQVNNGNDQNKSNKFDCLNTFCGLGRKLSAFQPQFYLTLMTTI